MHVICMLHIMQRVVDVGILSLVSCPARARLPARNVSPHQRVGSGDETQSDGHICLVLLA